MNLRKALFGILVLGLAGCSLAPFYQRPALPTAASYPGLEDAAGATAPSVDQVGWRDFFADLRLQELIAQALANNRDLRLAMARVEEARGLYGVQRADQFPNISGVATGEKYRLPADLSPTGNSLTAEQYSATLSLSAWELDFWGRVRNLTAAALESYLATMRRGAPSLSAWLPRLPIPICWSGSWTSWSPLPNPPWPAARNPIGS